MIAKRATKKLRDVGIEEFIINKGKYGFSIQNPTYAMQRSTVHKTADLAIAAAIAGERPTRMDTPERLAERDNINDMVALLCN